MSLSTKYREALACAVASLDDADRTFPTAVATAVVQVLPVSGAGISLATDATQRLPLGASSTEAAVAESLQFTAGDGPCLTAIRDGVVANAPGPILNERWPALAQLWAERTSFRSAASVPLALTDDVAGALNLFFAHEHGGRDLDAIALHVVARLAATDLLEWSGSGQQLLTRVWGTPPTVRRGDVWVVVGMVMESAQANGPDALDLLRSYAFAHDLIVDQVAQRVITGEIAVQDVVGRGTA